MLKDMPLHKKQFPTTLFSSSFVIVSRTKQIESCALGFNLGRKNGDVVPMEGDSIDLISLPTHPPPSLCLDVPIGLLAIPPTTN